MTKREPSGPPTPHAVATDLAELNVLAGRVLRLYFADYADAFEAFVGGSVVEFGSKNAQGGDNTGSAALGRDAARKSCSNAANLVKDALGKLRAAQQALDPKMPSTRAGRARVEAAVAQPNRSSRRLGDGELQKQQWQDESEASLEDSPD